MHIPSMNTVGGFFHMSSLNKRSIPSVHVKASRLDIQSESADGYRLLTCTANLGAGPRKAGHPELKHCFAKVLDADGQPVRTWSLGLHGVLHESFPEHESVACRMQAEDLGEADIARFDNAFEDCAGLGYRWGERDCCSCLERAVRKGLGIEPDPTVQQAARDLARSPDLSKFV